MKEQFVTYEIALKLKELGFNEECLYSIEYSEGGKTLKLNPNFKRNSTCDIGEITAPLWQQCIDWFREQFNLMINSPVPDEWNIGKWSVKLESLDKRMILEEYVGQPYWRIYRGFDSYKKAKEQAILKAIELCKEKKN